MGDNVRCKEGCEPKRCGWDCMNIAYNEEGVKRCDENNDKTEKACELFHFTV